MNKKITAIIFIIVLILGVWFLMSQNNTNTPAHVISAKEAYKMSSESAVATAPNQDTTTNTGSVSADAMTAAATTAVTSASPKSSVKSFVVTGSNFSFSPATLKVKKGDTVKITFKNSNGFHDLRIDEFKVATKQIKSPAQETITFVANKAGSFEYYCSVGSHRAMGMKGTLTVTQ